MMPRRLLLLACLLVVLAGQVRPGGCRHHARAGGLHPGNGGADPARPSYKSPLGLAVDRDGKVAYVALQTAGAVAVVDLHAGKVLEEIAVGGRPHDLALAGKDLFVTCEQADTVVRVSTVGRAGAARRGGPA
jgi:sugar lactone lactonase YvrE